MTHLSKNLAILADDTLDCIVRTVRVVRRTHCNIFIDRLGILECNLAILEEFFGKFLIDNEFTLSVADSVQICRRVDSIAMEVIVRNVIAGSMAHRLGMEEGVVPDEPVIDLCYKSEDLGEPLINDSHAIALGLVNKAELAEIYRLTRKINDVLVPVFRKIGITLVDFKIEFGRLPDGTIILSDDITPDSARFWDIETGMKLDKDRFRHDNGKVGQGYNTVYERLKAELNG